MAKSSATRAAEAGAGMAVVGEETMGSRLIGGAAELVGEVLTPLAIGKMVYDTFNYLHENAEARDQAISNMHQLGCAFSKGRRSHLAKILHDFVRGL
jgi:hypothetical protein